MLPDKLCKEALDRTNSYKKNYVHYDDIKLKMKKLASKGEFEMSIPESKIRKTEIRTLIDEGFKVEYKPNNLCGLFKSPVWKINWLKEGMDIVEEIKRGNPEGIYAETKDLVEKVVNLGEHISDEAELIK